MGETRGGALGGRRRIGRVRDAQKAVTLFSRQMATLLGAGLPIPRSLETLIRQERKKPFRAVLRQVAEQVRGGAPLSLAMAGHPRIFDHLLLGMTRAGEASGELPAVLGRVADFREKSARVRGKVRAAMVYPVVVMAVAACIVGLLMIFVVPQFQDIFRDMLRGQPLPRLTQAVIDLSHLVKDRCVAIAIFGGMFCLFLSLAARTGKGKRLIDEFLFRCPGTRAVVQRIAIARFARTFGTLVRAGVPILDALHISRDVVGNAFVQQAIETIHDGVRDGGSIASQLQASRVFSPMVPSMIEVGEETGRLPEMCDRLADAYEDELDNVVAGLASVVEPIMIVLLALVVGTVVIALFLPIISIIQNLGMR